MIVTCGREIFVRIIYHDFSLQPVSWIPDAGHPTDQTIQDRQSLANKANGASRNGKGYLEYRR